MKRTLFLLLATAVFVAGPGPDRLVTLDIGITKAEARPGGGGGRGGGGMRGGGMRGGGGSSFGARGGGSRMSHGSFGGGRPSISQPDRGGGGLSASRPATGGGVSAGTLPARSDAGLGAATRPSVPVGVDGLGGRPGIRQPIAGGPRPSHPIAMPPGTRPPGYRPPGWRPPGYRPPAYRPPYPRPPHYYWGDYNYWPDWGWYFTGAVAGATLLYVAELEDENCEEVTYEGERLYLCDGVLYRATMYKDEPVYEIVTEPDEVVGAGATSVASYEDDRELMLTSPGMQGDRVVALQEALVGKGYDVGGVDGFFGSGTDRALRAFQLDTGLSATGVADEPTRSALGI